MTDNNDFMQAFDEIDDEDYATISMKDDEGNEVEFIIVSSVDHQGATYLLVIESESADAAESDGIILKEVEGQGEEACFSVVTDDEEFEQAVALFRNCNDDYDIEEDF